MDYEYLYILSTAAVAAFFSYLTRVLADSRNKKSSNVLKEEIVNWRKALNEIAGGADKAQAIMDELSSLVNKRSNQIGRVRFSN